MNETTKQVHERIIGHVLPEQEKCSRCNGDGLEMCRLDGCDRDENKKCNKCKGAGIINKDENNDKI